VDEPIRILSDLHLGHKASLAREIAQVEPLYDGAHTVIFNGDTVEMRSPRSRLRAERVMHEVRAFCSRQKATTHFINGNHDPIISTTNHLEIADGSVLVTHGDVLFHEIAPWSEHADELGGIHDRLIKEMTPAERRSLEAILSTNKRVSQSIDIEDFNIPNGAWGQFSTFMRQTWPPKRFVKMVSSWKSTPVHAVNLVRLYRPEARCVIVGHTHYPGVWQRHGRTVINTGSYLPVLGRLAVDYADGFVTVRKVVLRRGKFHLGRMVARFRIPRQDARCA
jgi:predicted phosphodiesterase